MQETQLTNQQKVEIAAQVLRGERPEGDLKKYGIQIGEPQEITMEEFEKRWAEEQAATEDSQK